MDLFNWLVLIWILFIAMCVLWGISDAKAKKRRQQNATRTVKARIVNNGRVRVSASGVSADDAVINLVDKLCKQAMESENVNTIQHRIDEMRDALCQAGDRVSSLCSAHCRMCISKAGDHKQEIQAREAKRKAEIAREAEEKRQERVREMDEHKQMVAEQRRLMTDSLRYDILRRDGFRCQLCGATQKDGAKLHVDHIYPVSKGGKTEPNNLRTLCERCNLGKRDKIE